MVPRKLWVSENFSLISESRQRFYQVSEALFFLVWFRNCLSLELGFWKKGLASLGFYHSPPLLFSRQSSIFPCNWLCKFLLLNTWNISIFRLKLHCWSAHSCHMWPCPSSTLSWRAASLRLLVVSLRHTSSLVCQHPIFSAPRSCLPQRHWPFQSWCTQRLKSLKVWIRTTFSCPKGEGACIQFFFPWDKIKCSAGHENNDHTLWKFVAIVLGKPCQKLHGCHFLLC